MGSIISFPRQKLVDFPKPNESLESPSQSLAEESAALDTGQGFSPPVDGDLSRSEAEGALPSNVIMVADRFLKSPQQERRQAKRVILSHFVSCHALLPGSGLIPVMVRDVDDQGLSFEMDAFWGAFQRHEHVELRFYLDGNTYFQVIVEIAYSNLDRSQGWARHGGRFVSDSFNREAVYHFIQFLKTVAVSLRTDKGERVVSHLIS
ncbi:MAG: hypothetical protein NZ480_02630 [Bdellovibrionaceae bacterium]|nr:hypothetical protein [Pseudobdellovibrionaceae bacterium]